MEAKMSLGQAQKEMAGIDKTSLPSFLVLLCGAEDNKVRDFACSNISLLSWEEVVADIVNLLGILKGQNQFSKKRVQELFEELPGVFLEPQIAKLIEATADFDLVETAFKLLRKAPMEALNAHLEEIKEATEAPGIFIRRREMRGLLVLVLQSWSLDKKIKNHDYILELQDSQYQEFSALGNKMNLDVLATWPTADLKKVLHYLVSATESSEGGISYAAAHLAYRFLSSEHASQVIRAAYLDYMFQFVGWGHQELRRNFRALALDTLSKEYPAYTLPYARRLIECFDGSIPKERALAYELLKKIKPDELPLKLLLNGQRSGLYRVKRLTSRLTKKISGQALVNNLELLLKTQESDCRSERDLAARLAIRIPYKEIKKHEGILRLYQGSKNLLVKALASELLYFSR